MEAPCEDKILGCCNGDKMDMEMKNAVAIQRNGAAIAATIKALQLIQQKVEEINNSISGEGGILERINRLEESQADGDESSL